MALRRLRRSPGYVLAVVVNLALGLGCVSAILAVLHAVVLRPLPYPDPDRLVLIQHEMPGIEVQGEATWFGGFQGQQLLYAENSRLIEAIGVFGAYDVALVDQGVADALRAGYGSIGFFQALGARAQAGVGFRDDGTDAHDVLLSPGAWARRYGEDLEVMGRLLQVDGTNSRILGVMAEQGPFPAEEVDLWNLRSEQQIRQTPQLLVDGIVARMAPGATTTSLARELNRLIGGLPEYAPADYVHRAVTEGRLQARVTPLIDHVIGDVAPTLWWLLAAAGLVLLASFANLTNLQLLRADSRGHELAVRRALGARRFDLARQHLAEALLLVLMSSVASLALAVASLHWVIRTVPRDLPRAGEVALGPAVLAVILALAVTCAVGLALVQSLWQPSARDALRGGMATGSGGRARVRGVMASTELAVAVVLLVGSGLILRSFVALTRVDPGFDANSVLTFRLPFPLQEVNDVGGVGAATPFYDELAERLRGLVGVSSVGYAKCLPLSRLCGLDGLTFERTDRPIQSADHEELFGVTQVSSGYHETLSIPLLSGRLLEPRDHLQRTNNVVVSEAVVRQLWPGENPIGRQIRTPILADWSPFTVVGVVGEVHHATPRGEPEAVVYLPVLTREQQYELWTTSFVVRGSVAPLSLVDEVRAIVRELRPDIPVGHIEVLRQAVDRSTAGLRFMVGLMSAAALATLLLAATGVYGVVAYAVSLRRGEFGIRLALGADSASLRRLVFRQGLGMACVGVVVGLITARFGSRWLESMLFGIEPSDPVTYIVVALLLVVVALLACHLPARRAARVEPASVLRRIETIGVE